LAPASARGTDSGGAPEGGARLQLNPALTDTQLLALGLSPTGLIIAHALQKYGMYIVDDSGSSKIYMEYRGTSSWASSITRNVVSPIPWSAFRVVQPPAGP
jgi:hypothetical protein